MRHAAGNAVLASFAIALGLSQLAPVSPAWASPDLKTQSERVADVVAKALPSVVNVSTTKLVTRKDPFGWGMGQQQLGKSLGSGVIVSHDGYVLTNNHVISGARDIRVSFSNGREVGAKVVGADPKSDLAVLKLDKRVPNLRPIKLGSSTRMRLGETVLAVGNPFGVGQTVTMGIISAKGRTNMGILDYEDFIQTDAAINPGNSGGALINLRGELIGINTAILSRTGGSQGIGFAIPSDIARPIMRSLIRDGHVERGYLGVSIQTLDDDLIDALKLGSVRGVLVSDVAGGSPAARSGVHRNDVIAEVDGQPTRTAAALRTKIAAAGAGNTVALHLYRKGGPKTVRVKLGRLPATVKRGKGSSSSSRRPAAPDKLGVAVAPLDRRTRNRYDLPQRLRRGVVITSVREGSRAAELGLREGDVILEINRRPITSAAALRRAYKSRSRRLAMLVYRDGSAVYLTVRRR